MARPRRRARRPRIREAQSEFLANRNEIRTPSTPSSGSEGHVEGEMTPNSRVGPRHPRQRESLWRSSTTSRLIEMDAGVWTWSGGLRIGDCVEEASPFRHAAARGHELGTAWSPDAEALVGETRAATDLINLSQPIKFTAPRSEVTGGLAVSEPSARVRFTVRDKGSNLARGRRKLFRRSASHGSSARSPAGGPRLASARSVRDDGRTHWLESAGPGSRFHFTPAWRGGDRLWRARRDSPPSQAGGR